MLFFFKIKRTVPVLDNGQWSKVSQSESQKLSRKLGFGCHKHVTTWPTLTKRQERITKVSLGRLSDTHRGMSSIEESLSRPSLSVLSRFEFRGPTEFSVNLPKCEDVIRCVKFVYSEKLRQESELLSRTDGLISCSLLWRDLVLKKLSLFSDTIAMEFQWGWCKNVCFVSEFCSLHSVTWKAKARERLDTGPIGAKAAPWAKLSGTESKREAWIEVMVLPVRISNCQTYQDEFGASEFPFPTAQKNFVKNKNSAWYILTLEVKAGFSNFSFCSDFASRSCKASAESPRYADEATAEAKYSRKSASSLSDNPLSKCPLIPWWARGAESWPRGEREVFVSPQETSEWCVHTCVYFSRSKKKVWKTHVWIHLENHTHIPLTLYVDFSAEKLEINQVLIFSSAARKVPASVNRP